MEMLSEKSSRSYFYLYCFIISKKHYHLQDHLQFHLIWILLILILFSCSLPQKEKESLNEELHELKKENKLLKEKNALANQKKQCYEYEIKRLNKVSSQLKLERSDEKSLYKKHFLAWDTAKSTMQFGSQSRGLAQSLCNFTNHTHLPCSAVFS